MRHSLKWEQRLSRVSLAAYWLRVVQLTSDAILLAPCIAAAETITSNLTEAAGGSILAFNSQWAATSFATGPTAHTLTSVTAIVDSPSGNMSTFFIKIFTDAGGVPGSDWGSLIYPGAVPAPTEVVFLPSGTVSLKANTTYWLVFGDTTGAGFLGLNLTSSPNQMGPGTIGDTTLHSSNNGASWQNLVVPGLPIRMTVEGDAVAVPSGSGLWLSVALGCFGMLLVRRTQSRMGGARSGRMA